jgi:predicted RNase H-like nuclease (RuvC/YqgF family)
MGRRNKEAEENEQTIKELKAANRRLKSDNERLKKELATLHEAFSQTSKYLKGNTDNVSVEKIIEGVKKGSNLKEIKKAPTCEKCMADSVKELSVPAVGKILLCTSCSHRKVLKNGKDEVQQG